MLPVIEAVPIGDSYCSGIANVEMMPCGNLRLWGYATQSSQCGAGPLENVLVTKVILPATAVAPLILMLMAAMGVDGGETVNDVVLAASQMVHH